MGSRIRRNVQHLFECYCEVGPTDNNPEPHVRRIFPENFAQEDLLRSVPKFVYPCDNNTIGYARFSFVLTSADSKWIYGFCRHDPSTTLALVFLSYLPLHDDFFSLLEKVSIEKQRIDKTITENLIRISNEFDYNPNKLQPAFVSLLESYYRQPPPILDHCELPCIPKNVNLTEYYCAVKDEEMIHIFAALLNERRIIVRSKRPLRISACVQASNDLLYPMVWQHIFIPVLPKSLSEYLLAPMPFLIGVPDSVFQTINLEDIGDVVILDADNHIINTPFNDVMSLPNEVVSNLRRTLKRNDITGDVIPRAFLRAITHLIGGYREAIKCTNGVYEFDNEAFVSSRGTSMKSFLQKLISIQTFQQFIEERIELIKTGANQSDEFERECCNLEGQRSSLSSRAFGVVGNKISSSKFIRQVKDKAHPAMESAVESMRSGSRGMRSAYKGLRSKLENSSTVETFRPELHLPGPSGFTKVNDSNSSLKHELESSFKSYTQNNTICSWSTPNAQMSSTLKSNSKLNKSFKSSNYNNSLLDASPPSPLSPIFPEPLLPPRPSYHPQEVKTTNDLIQLTESNPKTNSNISNSEIELLNEYGLDFEKFHISRNNWTTFEE